MSIKTSTSIDDQTYTEVYPLTATPVPINSSDCENRSLSYIDRIESQINVIVPYLVLLGIVGNGLSILTFAQRKLRTLSCGCYLLLLAISDTIALLIISRPYFFKKFHIVHHLNSSIMCGLHFFFTKIFDELTPWLLVFVACNRLVLSRYPRNHHCFQTSRSALWSTFILLIILFIINIHLLYGIGVGYSLSDPCQQVCGPLEKSEAYLFFYQNINPIIDLSLSLVIPFCLLFVANIVIIVNVRRVKRRVLRIRRRKRASRNARLSIVLLADLITFLVVSVPVLLVECIYRFTRTRNNSPRLEEYLLIAWLFASKIFYLNYSLSFYFYVLTSSYFRHHFLLAIRCKKLHSIFYQPVKQQQNRQSYQMTDFISKNGLSLVPRPSRCLSKSHDLKYGYRNSNQPEEMANNFSIGLNESITIHESNRNITAFIPNRR